MTWANVTAINRVALTTTSHTTTLTAAMALSKEDSKIILNEYPQCNVRGSASATYKTRDERHGDVCISGTASVIESLDLTYIVMCTDGKLISILHVEQQEFVLTIERTLKFTSWKGREMWLSFEDEKECSVFVNALPPDLVKRHDKKCSSKKLWIFWSRSTKNDNVQRNTPRKLSLISEELEPSKPEPPPISTIPTGFETITQKKQRQPPNDGQQKAIGEIVPARSPTPPPSPAATRGKDKQADWSRVVDRRPAQCPVCQGWYPYVAIQQHANSCLEQRLTAAPPIAAENR